MKIITRVFFSLVELFLFLSFAGGVYPDEWIALGPKRRGMGRAGVATHHDVGSSYWNPAGLVTTQEAKGAKRFSFLEGPINLTPVGFWVPVSFGVSAEGDVIAEVDEVAKLIDSLNLEQIQNDLNAGTATPQDLQDALTIVDQIGNLGEPGQGVIANGGGGIELRMGNLAFFANGLAYAGIDPHVDFSAQGLAALADGGFNDVFNSIPTGNTPSTAAGQALSTNLANVIQNDPAITPAQAALMADELTYQAEQAGLDLSDPVLQDNIISVADTTVQAAAAANTLFNNQSGIEFKGILLKEFGISAGLPIISRRQKFSIGASLKVLEGETYYSKIAVKDIVDGEDIADKLLDQFDKNTRKSTKVSLDVGAIYSPVEGLRFGLTGKNITSPKFDSAGPGGDYTVRPQLRSGVAYSPIKMLTLALDIDILENETDALDGFKSRTIGGGIEFSPKIWLVGASLRCGAFQNIASDESNPVFTAGLGFKLWKARFDISGSYGPSKVKIEQAGGSEYLPEHAGASLSLTVSTAF